MHLVKLLFLCNTTLKLGIPVLILIVSGLQISKDIYNFQNSLPRAVRKTYMEQEGVRKVAGVLITARISRRK